MRRTESPERYVEWLRGSVFQESSTAATRMAIQYISQRNAITLLGRFKIVTSLMFLPIARPRHSGQVAFAKIVAQLAERQGKAWIAIAAKDLEKPITVGYTSCHRAFVQAMLTQ